MAKNAPSSKNEKRNPFRISKRTSIGGRHSPTNKHKRRNWKMYRGQG